MSTMTTPVPKLASPVAQAITEQPNRVSTVAMRVLLVLALERVRRGGNELRVKQLAEAARVPVEVVREAMALLRQHGSLVTTDEPSIANAAPENEDAIDAACYGDGFKDTPPVDQIGEDWIVGVC